MRSVITFVCVLLFAAVSGSPPAFAEKQALDGTGDITRMVARNGATAVTVDVSGLGPRCGGAQYVHLFIRNGNGRLLYEADGDCVSGQWGIGLYFTSTGVREDEEPVTCPRFTIGRAAGAYVLTIPRNCLDNAPDRIKMRVEGADYGTVTGGTAGPTRLLDRG